MSRLQTNIGEIMIKDQAKFISELTCEEDPLPELLGLLHHLLPQAGQGCGHGKQGEGLKKVGKMGGVNDCARSPTAGTAKDLLLL